MVHGPVHAGGSQVLLELIDEFGGAIEFDLARFQGIDLKDFFQGKRPATEIARRLLMLPHNSALAAHLAARPRTSPPAAVEPWRDHYAYNDTALMVRAVWSLLEAKFAGKKAKGFPKPGSGRGRSLASFAPPRPRPQRPAGR